MGHDAAFSARYNFSHFGENQASFSKDCSRPSKYNAVKKTIVFGIEGAGVVYTARTADKSSYNTAHGNAFARGVGAQPPCWFIVSQA